MKIFHSALVLYFITVTIAFAAWTENFSSVYFSKGIDEAVIMALTEGGNPDQIIKAALPLEGLKQEVLLKALFCALAQPDAIRNAAKKNSITDKTVDDGYQLALTVCRRQMEENLNAAMVQLPYLQENSSSSGKQRTVYSSPWKFE